MAVCLYPDTEASKQAMKISFLIHNLLHFNQFLSFKSAEWEKKYFFLQKVCEIAIVIYTFARQFFKNK
jgi:hypothetical protein